MTSGFLGFGASRDADAVEPRFPVVTDKERFLTIVADLMSRDGYVTRKVARETGAVDTATRAFAEFTRHADRVCIEYIGEVRDAIAAARVIEPRTDFDRNLRIAAFGDAVDAREVGTLAYVLPWHRKNREYAARDTARVTAAAGKRHVGTVGSRSTFTVTVDRIKSFEGNFGMTDAISFIDADGNDLTWFTASNHGFEVGDAATITATVKDHDEFRGTPVTKLTRVTTVTNPARDARVAADRAEYAAYEAGGIEARVREASEADLARLADLGGAYWVDEFKSAVASHPRTLDSMADVARAEGRIARAATVLRRLGYEVTGYEITNVPWEVNV